MEENRLTPMVAGYDEKMFNRLYARTEGLRKKLTSGIDHRKFGLQYEDILSFFDTKFLFVFNKYCMVHTEEVLLGHIINALQFFQCRIMRATYTQKFSQSITSLDTVFNPDSGEEWNYDLVDHPKQHSNDNYYYTVFMDFMKKHLSLNAFTLLELQLNPPPYILTRMNTSVDCNIRKIPDHLILDYFDLGDSGKAVKFLGALKKEIRKAVNYAQLYFKNTTL